MTNKYDHDHDAFDDLLRRRNHLKTERQLMLMAAAEHVIAGRLSVEAVRDVLKLTPFAYGRQVAPWIDHLVQGNGVGS